tara:strand:+ start:20072 stop:20455 length:384 start_codon:yes stop_codon:yes gene_type:complete
MNIKVIDDLSDHIHDLFYKGLSEGSLLYFECGKNCGPVEYAARVCPKCGSDLRVKKATGRGQVHSSVVYHIQYSEDKKTPYSVLFVELEEGPRLLGSTFIENDLALEIGTDVIAVIKPNGVLTFKAS